MNIHTLTEQEITKVYYLGHVTQAQYKERLQEIGALRHAMDCQTCKWASLSNTCKACKGSVR